MCWAARKKDAISQADPAILELCFEPRHAVTEIGRQFRKADREREKKAQHECPCRQWTEQHVGGDHGVAEDRRGERHPSVRQRWACQ